jgi:hypothetical protein
MNKSSHRRVTEKAFDFWSQVNAGAPSTAWQNILWSNKEAVAIEARTVDEYEDLEFIDVEGGIFDHGRDNPHSGLEVWPADIPHYKEKLSGRPLTAYNHYIDIKKGAGQFDDYDGYSYKKGSASTDQHQSLVDAAQYSVDGFLGFLAELASYLPGAGSYKLDEGIAEWLDDEYVHAPGQQWYRCRRCSPALERYSFPQDRGVYGSQEEELKARFPLAQSTRATGKGVPYSVFMPVDNMARYWYAHFLGTRDPIALGPVMHAIQDASVPHHAAGYNGNWHVSYENDLDDKLAGWLENDEDFAKTVIDLFTSWNRTDDSPPTRLTMSDLTKTPAINWRIDHLVTWVALNAYGEYGRTYNHFRNGYSFHETSAKELTAKATAMSMLVLRMASTPGNPQLSFESYNYPDHFIRHQNFRGKLSKIGFTSDLDRKDSTFRIVNGLAKPGVSFESLNYPGHYLRHRNFEIWLDELEGNDTELFREDATFHRRPGLADESYVSFEAYNYKGYFIRHRNLELYVEKEDADLFRADATFLVKPPNWALGS